MRVSNVSTKEKRRYALDNLGGVDFSSSPLLCAPTRSPDAENWIGDHGINRKRNGWEQVMDRFIFKDGNGAVIGNRINSITQISETTQVATVLVHERFAFHVLKLSKASKTVSVEDVTVLDGIAIKNRDSQCFLQGDKVYIIGAADSMIVCAKNSQGKYVITSVDPYIPTTSIDIDDTSVADPARSTADYVNLLTPRRKNTLRGADKDTATWKLDGMISKEAQTIVRCNGKTYKTVQNDSVSGYTAVLFLEGKIGSDEFGRIDYAENTVTATINTKPTSNNANITIEYADTQSSNDIIGGCTFGILYGYGGAHDRLFLSGNTYHPNVVFFSEENDFSYFPDLYTITLGGENDPAKGFVYLSDNTLAALCEKSVYYIGGEARNEYDENGEIKRITPVFTRQAGAINEGALNAFCTANFGGDNVFLSKHGLFGIEPTSNVLTNTRTARERSYAINARLNLLDPAKASIFTHGQRLYVSDGENCFVADSAYKYMPTGSESYNYEWWYWTHVPARVWAEVNGELWFGTADGRVCRFTDGYKDVAFDYSLKGETVVEIKVDDYGNISYYDADDLAVIAPGKRVQIEGGWNAEIEETGEKISLTDHANLYVYKVETDNGVHYMHLSRYADGAGEETLLLESGTPILRVYDDQPVVAEWVSPPLDLGNDSIAKTLFSLSVTAEAGQNSILKFGHETRRNSSEFDAVGLGKFDWATFDFNEFTFETGFQNTYTVRAHDRNFNFIRFHLRSDGDRPCAVHRIAAIYKNNKYSKGVV